MSCKNIFVVLLVLLVAFTAAVFVGEITSDRQKQVECFEISKRTGIILKHLVTFC